MGRIGYSRKLLREFVGFARAHKAYWIVPLALILGLTALVIVGTNAAAPVIYALF